MLKQGHISGRIRVGLARLAYYERRCSKRIHRRITDPSIETFRIFYCLDSVDILFYRFPSQSVPGLHVFKQGTVLSYFFYSLAGHRRIFKQGTLFLQYVGEHFKHCGRSSPIRMCEDPVLVDRRGIIILQADISLRCYRAGNVARDPLLLYPGHFQNFAFRAAGHQQAEHEHDHNCKRYDSFSHSAPFPFR